VEHLVSASHSVTAQWAPPWQVLAWEPKGHEAGGEGTMSARAVVTKAVRKKKQSKVRRMVNSRRDPSMLMNTSRKAR
jgi:hypothetical protein